MEPLFDDLICPDCHSALQSNLQNGHGTLGCPAGHGPWPVERKIVWFPGGEVLHDGRWTGTYKVSPRGGLMGWLQHRDAHWGIPRLLAPMIARAGRYPLDIVDLGCGGGWEFLTKFGKVTGVDHAAGGLAAAASVYDRVIRAPVDKVPLADHSVDVMVSVWLFEHLPEARFVATLTEIRRLLRPGGRLVFFTDLDSLKPILRWAKRNPELYCRHHIASVGHYGLRSLQFTKFILHREGFVENETVPVNKSSLLQPVTALWMFNNELGRRSKIMRLYLSACRLGLKSRLFYRLIYLGLMEYHRLADRWLPDGYAFSAAFDCILPRQR